MKAITVKAPLVWAIFNAGHSTLYRNEHIDCPSELAIHVGKFCTQPDVEEFSRKSGLILPPRDRLFLGQVIGVVDVVRCQRISANYSRVWHIANPRPIKRFCWQGQSQLYEIPNGEIDFDADKNPILEESGCKFKGNPRGEWWVTVWRHPHVENHYSFSASIAGGVMSGGIPGDTLLHGCYGDPEEALQAGIKELYS
ncbi:hypothetical protein NSTC745_06425 [Nostoc sp. DSM 114161]|jgi:hypothetical protein|uniref:hypothetical protein n=1 Tax=Nostoc sp. DSM 114161 TaxID=3440143 RepID=UPI004045F175